MSDPLIVGVGQRLRRDDGVGPWIAERLSEAGADARVHEGDGTGLIDHFGAAQRIIVVDAAQSGRMAGTLIEIDAAQAPLAAGLFRYSTHRFGLAEAVETARALDLLPESLTVFGIEGADFSAGEGLTDNVLATAEALLKRLYPSR